MKDTYREKRLKEQRSDNLYYYISTIILQMVMFGILMTVFYNMFKLLLV